MDKVLRPEGLETDSNSERMTSLETINLRKIVAVVPREVQPDPNTLAAVESEASSCFCCGNNKHPRSKCPARHVICSKRQKRGQ